MPTHKQKVEFNMYKRITTLVSSAVEAITPVVKTRSEAFVDHWTHVQSYYVPSDPPLPTGIHVTSTAIPYHLSQLITFLHDEDSEMCSDEAYNFPTATAAPCLDLLIQERLVEKLVSWAKKDNPPGMRDQVLTTLTSLLTGHSIARRLLPEASIRNPLVHLIESCHPAGGQNHHLLNLLHELFQVLIHSPYLFGLMLKTDAKGRGEFAVFEVLVGCIVARGEAGQCARNDLKGVVECLKCGGGGTGEKDILRSVRSKKKPLLHRTRSSHRVFTDTEVKTDPTPPSLHVPPASVARDAACAVAEEEFWEFWGFVDEVVGVECEVVTTGILNAINERFFIQTLLPQLRSSDLSTATQTTHHLTSLLDTSQSRLTSLLTSLITDAPTVDVLTHRINNVESEELALVTLRMFSGILDTFEYEAWRRVVGDAWWEGEEWSWEGAVWEMER
ncbi:hypothetical protein HK104_004416 [Borealophlyctis nickersoniae]|nr:hypothetical protein HK104_004416 [Borealophlyctis nickersoniae]